MQWLEVYRNIVNQELMHVWLEMNICLGVQCVAQNGSN
ncbi:hypothetical protein JCM19236_507 [Vibrio sp. JCM 19236]|nr:hypothetical protein JCM19236_507 [Vibrio sp. JCM 19236]